MIKGVTLNFCMKVYAVRLLLLRLQPKKTMKCRLIFTSLQLAIAFNEKKWDLVIKKNKNKINHVCYLRFRSDKFSLATYHIQNLQRWFGSILLTWIFTVVWVPYYSEDNGTFMHVKLPKKQKPLYKVKLI